MYTTHNNPSKREVLERIGMTEMEIQQLFERSLTATDEEFAEMMEGHEEDISAITAVMETPDEIIARAKKLLAHKDLQ